MYGHFGREFTSLWSLAQQILSYSYLSFGCNIARPFGLSLGLPYVRVSPDTSSFWASIQASGSVFKNRRFVRVFVPVRKYIQMLPIAEAYDGTRQKKAR